MLVGLYEEPDRPPNAVEYVKKVMGAPVGVDVDALKAENERLKAENSAFPAAGRRQRARARTRTRPALAFF